MIVNQVARSLQPAGLGLITPQINRLDLNDDYSAWRGMGQTRGGLALTLFGAAVGMAFIGTGAYLGARRSPGWAAGGAVLGNVAFAVVALGAAAALGARSA